MRLSDIDVLNTGNVERLLFVTETQLLFSQGYGSLSSWNIQTGEIDKLFLPSMIGKINVDYYSTISSDGRYIAF